MTYGDGVTGSGYTRRGCASSKFPADVVKFYEITVKLNANIKQIRIFTGTYHATAEAKLLYKDKTILTKNYGDVATAQSGYLVIDLGVEGIDWSVNRQVSIQIKATGGDGNASIVAVQTLDTLSGAVVSTATAKATNETIVAGAGTDTKMSTYGAVDYCVVTGESTVAKNPDNRLINPRFGIGLKNDLGTGGDWGNDNGASEIKYGASDELSSRNFKHNAVSIDVEATITANQIVSLFVTGWQSSYGIAVFDADGNVVNNFDIRTADDDAHPRPNIARITIDTAGTYRFVLYSVNLNGNIGIAAVGISNK